MASRAKVAHRDHRKPRVARRQPDPRALDPQPLSLPRSAQPRAGRAPAPLPLRRERRTALADDSPDYQRACGGSEKQRLEKEDRMKLKDRVAVVTGGASGIGAASAIAMAAEGARIVIGDVNEAAAEVVRERIQRIGGQALAIRADVTRALDNETLVERAVSAWGRLDVFYANAGVPQWKMDLEAVEDAVYDRIMDVNVKGVWLGAKFALPVMKRAKRGVFLITASSAGIRPRPGGQTYAMSKGAVITLAKALALEVAPHGVRVVAICPVATHTPMLPTFMGKKEVDAESLARYEATVPLGRLNKPEDIANAAVFLASDDAAMITGSTIEVDGGRCI